MMTVTLKECLEDVKEEVKRGSSYLRMEAVTPLDERQHADLVRRFRLARTVILVASMARVSLGLWKVHRDRRILRKSLGLMWKAKFTARRVRRKKPIPFTAVGDADALLFDVGDVIFRWGTPAMREEFTEAVEWVKSGPGGKELEL